MHPLVPYLLGEKHPLGKRLVNVQRCIRTGDIDEVGDTYHHTFFEMLGNWSLGDYFKKEAIEFSFEFLTNWLKLDKKKLAVSVFEGNKQIPKDEEAAKIWQSVGIPKERIVYLGKKENWWELPGQGPCGPDTEMFYYKSGNPPKTFNPDDDNWVEIWNDVLMQYNKDEKGSYNEAKQKNIDTGMGVERTITILNGLEDNYLSDCFKPIIEKIETLSGRQYLSNTKITKAMRIIADHIKAATFIIADGIKPSNTEQGYILRRLIRRAIRYGRQIGMEKFTREVAKPVFAIYDDYGHLFGTKEKIEKILQELEREEENFLEKLKQGMKVFEKIINSEEVKQTRQISGKSAFLLYQSYGFPIEITKELAREKQLKVDEKAFQKEFEKHQEKSKSDKKFKSGLADNSEETTKLHTATHLLNQALREVLNKPDLHQAGSNITPERLRFDFNFPRKLTDEEKQQVEDWVNDKIQKDLPVQMKEMSVQEAKDIGAQGIFEDKYKNLEKVKVYLIGKNGEASKEICAGPHVTSLSKLGKFKIKKEESSSAGVRRIKAILE
ncbi:MAG: alanine--tRNA ligase, partial [Candidatus Nanoarchaeia archaeon]